VTCESLVTVVVITYNHESYIKEAISSILTQETDFPVEIIISDDSSTDGTRRVIDETLEAQPTPHRVIKRYRQANLGRRGMNNFVRTISEATGQYIALLEGDDYWTSPHKIATQARFLASSPNVSLAGHRTDRVYAQDGNRVDSRPLQFTGIRTFDTKKVLWGGNIIHTSSFMFRRDPSGEMIRYLEPFACGDLPLLVYHAVRGLIAVDSSCMSHYRLTGRGICSTPNNSIMPDIQLSVYERLLFLFPEYQQIFCRKVACAQITKASSLLRSGAPINESLALVRAAWNNDPVAILQRFPTVGKMLLRAAVRHCVG
jgi:glycosyltransferase involved in cell wall biosynthesis